MTEAYASDFHDDTAFERLVLERVAPLVPRDIGTAFATYDVEKNSIAHSVGLHETIGMTLPEAVEQLGIAPLAFGAAWKVLDLLVEHGLSAAGYRPGRGSRWTITEKVAHARRGMGKASPISTDAAIWTATLLAYAESEESRHSLVHRRADVDSAGTLIGVDRTGAPLRPVTRVEQLGFCRATQIVASAVVAGTLSMRDRRELCWQLDQLIGLTGLPSSGSVKPQHPIPLVHVHVPAEELDLAAIKKRLKAALSTATSLDVVFVLPTGERLFADYEAIPNSRITLDPAFLPPWASLLP